MKYLLLLVAILSTIPAVSQTVTNVSTPQHIAIDSKDNVFVALKYGIIKIAPDGKITNLTKVAGTIGDLDRTWSNLIIDSKDRIYANDGKLIYRFTFDDSGTFVGKIFAGQQWSYKLEDGPISTAGFNTIRHMTIDKDDNIYLTDSYDKIKDSIGSNFVTDSFYLNDPAKKYVKYPARNYSVIRRISSSGIVSTLKTLEGKFVLPNNVGGLAADQQGNVIFTSYSFGRFVGKIEVTTGAITVLAGQPYKREWCPVYTQGDVSKGEFVEPETIIVNNEGEVLFADQRINRIIKIAAGRVSTLAGGNIIDPCSQNIAGRSQEGNRDGKALSALFNFPKGMAYDSKGNLYIADMNNHSIRKLTPDGMVTTFAK
jgi:hypothetical protein